MRVLARGAFLAALVITTTIRAQQPRDQWPNYQHNSNYSPLTQITPANVTLTKAVFNSARGPLRRATGSIPVRSAATLITRQYVSSELARDRRNRPCLRSNPKGGKVICNHVTRNINGRGLAYAGKRNVGPRLYFATDMDS